MLKVTQVGADANSGRVSDVHRLCVPFHKRKAACHPSGVHSEVVQVLAKGTPALGAVVAKHLLLDRYG